MRITWHFAIKGIMERIAYWEDINGDDWWNDYKEYYRRIK